MSLNCNESEDNKEVNQLFGCNNELSRDLCVTYPIHWTVWHNDCHHLELIIKSNRNVFAI